MVDEIQVSVRGAGARQGTVHAGRNQPAGVGDADEILGILRAAQELQCAIGFAAGNRFSGSRAVHAGR